MGLFSGFEKLGLGNFENAEIIEKNAVKSDAQQAVVVKTPEEKEREAIFDKHYTCPVCDLSFSSKMSQVMSLPISKSRALSNLSSLKILCAGTFAFL